MNFLKKAKKVLTPEDAFNGTAAIKFSQGGLFAPGERVGGELIWTREKPCAIRNITASLNGTLKCSKFREPGGIRLLLNGSCRLIYQSPRGGNRRQLLDKGRTEYSFSLPDLPPSAQGLPDSFVWDEEGLCATYWIEFVFWTGDKKKHVCRAPFVMMRPVPDLRKLPLQSSKIPSLFKAPNHKISLTVAQMPPLVHPGQQLDFDFRIVNCSTKSATCLGIQLERRTQLHGKKQVKTVAAATFTEPVFVLPRLPKGLDPQASQDIAPKVERTFSLQIPTNLADLPNSWDFRGILSVKYTLAISLLLGSSRWTIKTPVVLRETDPLTLITSVPVVPPQQAPELLPHRPAPLPPTGGPAYPHHAVRPTSSSLDGGAPQDFYGGHHPPPAYYYAPSPYGYPESPFPPPPTVHAYQPDYGHFPPRSSSSSSQSPSPYPQHFSPPPSSSSSLSSSSPFPPPYPYPEFVPSSSAAASTPSLPATMHPHPHPFYPAQSSLPNLPAHSPSPTAHSDHSVSPLYPVLDYPPAPWSHSPHPDPSDHYSSLHSWTPPPPEFTIKPSAPPIDA